jgi:hypothetical protein
MKTDPQSKCSNCLPAIPTCCKVGESISFLEERTFSVTSATGLLSWENCRLTQNRLLNLQNDVVIRRPNQITLISPYRSPHWPSESRSVGVFFLGIGFALVKQLVGVDIGFTPLAVRWPPSTTEDGVSPPQSGASHFQARRNKYG